MSFGATQENGYDYGLSAVLSPHDDNMLLASRLRALQLGLEGRCTSLYSLTV
jgi:hypothetical protein